MNRVYFFDTQTVLSDDLNDTQYNLISQSILRTQAPLGYSGGWGGGVGFEYASGSIFQGGVYGNPANYLSAVNLQVHKFGTTLIVAPGKALDTNGDLIVVNSSLTLTKGTTTSSYSWISSPSVQNYIKISYQESSGSAKADDYGVQHYTRYSGSYYINVDSSPQTGAELLLGTFIADSSGYPTDAVVDRRLYITTITPASGVILDPTNKPVSSWVSVEDHINAVGSSTPTNVNPHGLRIDDLGGFHTEEHVALNHENGIILDDTPEGLSNSAKNSWKASINPDNFTLHFEPPYSASASIGGKIFTGTLPDFPTSGVNGSTYYIVTDSSGSVSQILTSALTGNQRDSQYLKLCAITVISSGDDIEFVNFGGEELDGDCRRFYGTSIQSIRLDVTESLSPITTFTTDDRYLNLETNLGRIRYQLAKAIDGSSNWKHTNPPLTAGPSSYADSYHSHAGTPQSYWGIGQGATTDSDRYLRFYRGSSSAYSSIYWNPTNERFSFYKNASPGLADISVESIYLGYGSYAHLTGAQVINLTDGSDADSLHTHNTFGSPITVGGVSLTGSNLTTLLSGVNADSLHTHSDFPASISVGGTTLSSASITDMFWGADKSSGREHNGDYYHYHRQPFMAIGTYDQTTRDANIIYQNDDYYPAWVAVRLIDSGSVAGSRVTLKVYITGASGSHAAIAETTIPSGSWGVISGIVPPHFYFQVATGDVGNVVGVWSDPVNRWWEIH